jgi:hypothetical protein
MSTSMDVCMGEVKEDQLTPWISEQLQLLLIKIYLKKIQNHIFTKFGNTSAM